MTQKISHWLLIQLPVKMDIFYIIYRTDKIYAACSHINLAVETLSKNCLNYSRQRKRRKCKHIL